MTAGMSSARGSTFFIAAQLFVVSSGVLFTTITPVFHAHASLLHSELPGVMTRQNSRDGRAKGASGEGGGKESGMRLLNLNQVRRKVVRGGGGGRWGGACAQG